MCSNDVSLSCCFNSFSRLCCFFFHKTYCLWFPAAFSMLWYHCYMQGLEFSAPVSIGGQGLMLFQQWFLVLRNIFLTGFRLCYNRSAMGCNSSMLNDLVNKDCVQISLLFCFVCLFSFLRMYFSTIQSIDIKYLFGPNNFLLYKKAYSLQWPWLKTLE